MEHKSTEKGAWVAEEWLEDHWRGVVRQAVAVFVVIGDERWVMVPEETFDTMEER